MPAVNKATVFLTGKFYWTKVLGTPRPNYAGDAREWAFEFEPDAAGVQKLKDHKIADRLKNKYEDRGAYLVLKKSELNRDGNPNTPIRVYDAQEAPADPRQDKAWDKTKLIGNESKGSVKLDIRDYGPGKKKGIYPVAIRVTELVEYQVSEFGGMEGDGGEAAGPAKSKAKDQVKEDFGLDDELPI